MSSLMVAQDTQIILLEIAVKNVSNRHRCIAILFVHDFSSLSGAGVYSRPRYLGRIEGVAGVSPTICSGAS